MTYSDGGDNVSGSATPGGLPVTVRTSAARGLSIEQAEQRLLRGLSAGDAPAGVEVTVLDQAAAARLGVKGVVLTVAPSAGSSFRSPVEVSVDYSGFANAYGGGYADRLRMTELPACALTTPDVDVCQVQTPMAGSRNDRLTSSVSVPVDFDRGSAASQSALDQGGELDDPIVMAMSGGSSSEQGNFGATSLPQTGSWQNASSGGAFTYSVPITVPPAPGDLHPEVYFAYSSDSVDGLTKSTTSQASWIGEGWSYHPGYIERSYRPCYHDGHPSNHGDLCWVDGSPVTLSMDGVTTRLFEDDDPLAPPGTWRAEDDSAGWRVERLTGLNNGARLGEAFKITTSDGTQYWFGSEHPNDFGGALNVPVFGNNAQEPCNHSSGFYYSVCDMPYRWNLDRIVDVHSNVIDFRWTRFQGLYGGNNGANLWLYDISSTLKDILYGANLTAMTLHTGAVVFDTAYRCFQTVAICDTPGNQHLWMDVPWDLYCPVGYLSCGTHNPTFWEIYRLSQIRTQIWTGGGFSDVDTWATTQGFPSTGDYISPSGDDSSPALWLSRVWRPGDVFPLEMFGTQYFNRVDYGTGKPPMTRYRVTQIDTGTGASVNIRYNNDITFARDCQPSQLSGIVQDQNTRRCFPQNNGGTLSWWHKYVVTDVWNVDNLAGAPNELWHYEYHAIDSSTAVLWKHDQNWHTPPSQRTWSRWAGYPTVLTRHGAYDGTGPQQYSHTLFFRGMHGDKTIAGGWGTRTATIDDWWDHAIPDVDPLAGQARRTVTWKVAPNLYAPVQTDWASASITHHQVTDTGTHYVLANPAIEGSRVRVSQTQHVTQMAGPAYRWHKLLNTYDADGHLTKVEDQGDDAVSGDERCTLTTYTTANTTTWIHGLPTQTLTTNCATTPAGADYLAGRQAFYDGATALTAVPTKGNLTQTTALATTPAAGQQPAGANWKQSARVSGHDAHGRAIDEFDAMDFKITTTYTPTVGGPVTATAVTGPMGTGWTTTTTFDPGRGQPTSVVDVNGKVTRLAYDTLGRLSKVWMNHRAPMPGDMSTVMPDMEYTYNFNPNWVTSKELGPNGSQIASHEIFDGLLRPRQSQASSPTGTGRTITDIAYNGIGEVAKASMIYNSSPADTTRVTINDSQTKLQTRYTYDNLGRTTLVEPYYMGSPRGASWNTSYTYDGDKTIKVTPPSGDTAITTVNDVRGNTTELREHQGGTPAGIYTSTTYTFDRLGQLSQVKDPANNIWTYTYDPRGRITTFTDPDSGTSTTAYDDNDRVVTATDARGSTLFNSYDALDRPTELRETSAGGNLRASWTYDSLGYKGTLASTTRHDPTGNYTTTVNTYDNAYRPTQITQQIPGFGPGGTTLPYAKTYSYKPNGALDTESFDGVGGLSAETLTYSYDSLGLPSTVVAGSQTYVSAIAYAYTGQVDTLTLGNNGKRVKQTYIYDEATRRPASTNAAVETSPNTFATKYIANTDYDPSGNIASIATTLNSVADQQECFRYDHLRRLTEAWTQNHGACTTPQRSGADPYWRTWTNFDTVGNRGIQTDKNPGVGDTTWTYQFGAAGSVTPHQLKQVTSSGPLASPTRSFSYDAAGNMLTRTSAAGIAQSLTWDHEGNLASLTENGVTTGFVYDTDGQRLLTSTPTKKILHLSDGTQLEKIGAANPVGTRHYAGIAVRNAAGLTWAASNHQGTGVLQIDSTTLSLTSRRFMPYGEARGTQPAGWQGTQGYVDGTQDPTGLTHLGAREYDPTLGRFISIDPIIDLSDPQSWHGYSYSANSPVTFSDPDGLKKIWGGDVTGGARGGPGGGGGGGGGGTGAGGSGNGGRGPGARTNQTNVRTVTNTRDNSSQQGRPNQDIKQAALRAPANQYTRDAATQQARPNADIKAAAPKPSTSTTRTTTPKKPTLSTPPKVDPKPPVKGGKPPNTKGKQGDDAVPGTKNTETIRVNGRDRTPDRLTPGRLGEIKNRDYVHDSTQLRDYQQAASNTNRQMDLWVRSNTRLSAPLQAKVDGKTITRQTIPGT